MIIDHALTDATQHLQAANIQTARLDSLVLLSHLLLKDKSWILAHGDYELSADHYTLLHEQVTQRCDHEPLAYILGTKEFYGHDFIVTPDVLIPRPETENLIELLAELQPQSSQKLLDVGTGSGAIAISCKLRWPELDVTATDISPAALKIATENAQLLGAVINCQKSDLLKDVPLRYAYILANLPYVDHNWQRSPETDHEPALALFADDEGLDLIKKLITQAKHNVESNGYLLLEADPRQLDAIRAYSENLGYRYVASRDFAIVLQIS